MGPRNRKETRRLTGQAAFSEAFAFAPDGKTFATTDGSALRICDVVTGRELGQRDGHTSSAGALAVSTDGRTLATGANYGVVLLWDLATGQQRRRLVGSEGRVSFLAFSPDGRTLYSASSTNMQQLLLAWDTATGAERLRLVGNRPMAWVSAAALSPDGKLLGWAGLDKASVVVDANTSKELRRLDGPDAPIVKLAFEPDNRTLLAMSDLDRSASGNPIRFHFWDVVTGQHRETLSAGLPWWPGQMMISLGTAFSPDVKRVALGGQYKAIVLVDPATGNELGRVAAASDKHADTVLSVAWSPDGRTLAWAGPLDGVVRVSEVASGKERRPLKGHHGTVWSLAFSATGAQLISAGRDTTALVWDLTGPTAWGNEPPEPLNDANLAACWEHLHGDDAAKAYVAVRRLIADPARAVPYLAQRLRPAVPADEQRVARLIADLDSDDFAVRDRAVKELERTGDLALPALGKASAGKPSLEMQRRMDQLVQKLATITSEQLRAIRAIEALECAATQEARHLLGVLAQGAPGVRQTLEARASLNRLSKR